MIAHDIIIRPLVSEKSVASIKAKKYAFVVHPDADKTQIKNAVEEVFGVKVE
ncbi:MAG: 50S ribosomal protein L23, partial [Clostridia bacterium]|nr:50S ribosomal protein L23 [Clostridia bacterium]